MISNDIIESMANDRTPLYVRLPRKQAAALDRLAQATGRPKQHLVSELLADRLPTSNRRSLTWAEWRSPLDRISRSMRY